MLNKREYIYILLNWQSEITHILYISNAFLTIKLGTRCVLFFFSPVIRETFVKTILPTH